MGLVVVVFGYGGGSGCEGYVYEGVGFGVNICYGSGFRGGGCVGYFGGYVCGGYVCFASALVTI